jgi:hypothetical protein
LIDTVFSSVGQGGVIVAPVSGTETRAPDR